MADGAVSFVLGKLWDLALKEAALYEQVGEDMQLLRDRLEWLQSFLREADQKHRANESGLVGVWVRQTRDMTFLMEDSLDEFLHGLYRGHWGFKPWKSWLRWAPPIVRDLWIRNDLQSRVRKINNRLKQITDRKDEYKIKLDSSKGEASWTYSQTTELAAWDRLEDQTVDFELDESPDGVVPPVQKLERLLLDPDDTDRRLRVICLGGESGMGKTTLANKLYYSVQITNRFHVRVKVSMPPKLRIAGLLFRIYRDVEQQLPAASAEREGQQLPAASAEREGQQLPAASAEREGQQLPAASAEREGQQLPAASAEREGQQLPADSAERVAQQLPEASAEREEQKKAKKEQKDIGKHLKSLLKETRFLIVLDGVVTIAHWNTLRDSLPADDRSSSRVLLIPQAEGKDTEVFSDHMVELRELSATTAKELFYLRVFGSHRFPDRHLGDNKTYLDDCEKRIAQITGGVPLAIVLLAGLLRSKEFPLEWKAVLKPLQKTTTPRKRLAVLLSRIFDDLPHRLKSCFLYFATMPENTEMDAHRLVRLWIAEGLVQQQKGKTKEEIGQRYLKELISRCLVQLVDRGPYGGVEKIAIHDRVHAFVQSEAQDLSFAEIHHNAEVLAPATVRRLALQNFSADHVSMDNSFPKLRSLLCHFSEQPTSASVRLSFTDKLWHCLLGALSSVRLCPPPEDMDMQLGLQTLEHLHRSKFLRVIDLEGLRLEELPGAIGSLIHLSYLGLRCPELETLPRSLEKLRNLQTLDVRTSKVRSIHGAWRIQALRHVLGGLLEVPESFVAARGLSHMYTLCVGSCTGLGRMDSGSTSTAAPNNSAAAAPTLAGTMRTPPENMAAAAAAAPCSSPTTPTKTVPTPFKNMPYLRYLELGGIQSGHLYSLTLALENRDVLVSLVLEGTVLPKNLFAISGLRGLQELSLDGKLEKVKGRDNEAEAEGHFTLPNLFRLTLSQSQVDDQFIKGLAELPSLAELTLNDDAFRGEMLKIPGGFASLRKLELRDLKNVGECIAEASAMVRLRSLAVRDCPKMTLFAGLQNAEELKEAVLAGVPKMETFLGLERKQLDEIRTAGMAGEPLPQDGLAGKIKLPPTGKIKLQPPAKC